MAVTRVLIANRGEIALRVVRACADLRVTSITVYGDGDDDALHVQRADEAYRLQSSSPRPYLDMSALIEVAKAVGADAVHPGYGFLAENADFAEACEAAGLTFVGPPASAIRAMGEKIAAREIAQRAGVPIAPGSDGPLPDVEAARRFVADVGYPIALKASAGGGGRGFRIVREAAGIEGAFRSAASESERAFGNATLYGERYVDRPRHVEVQVFADAHGNVVAIGDRDCSIQRRHQKLVEECPAPGLASELRSAMADAAIALTREVGYRGAGTLEFLVEGGERFYFLEMNTRIQVEHTVTEEVFGVDLVREQLLVASGDPLSFGALAPRGHAIQCRLNAEDPGRDFTPAPGTVSRLRLPAGPGVRVDAAIEGGTTIHPAYDSLIAKLVVHGADRTNAIARMSRALAETVIVGVPSTLELHRAIIGHPAFAAGELSTAFLPEHPEVVPSPAEASSGDEAEPAEWRSTVVEVNGRRFAVRVRGDGLGGAATKERTLARAPSGRPTPRGRSSGGASGGAADLKSPLQGVVLRVAAETGQTVQRGSVVLVIEAMKMENEITAHQDGVLTAIHADVGKSVRSGDPLFTIATQE